MNEEVNIVFNNNNKKEKQKKRKNNQQILFSQNNKGNIIKFQSIPIDNKKLNDINKDTEVVLGKQQYETKIKDNKKQIQKMNKKQILQQKLIEKDVSNFKTNKKENEEEKSFTIPESDNDDQKLEQKRYKDRIIYETGEKFGVNKVINNQKKIYNYIEKNHDKNLNEIQFKDMIDDKILDISDISDNEIIFNDQLIKFNTIKEKNKIEQQRNEELQQLRLEKRKNDLKDNTREKMGEMLNVKVESKYKKQTIIDEVLKVEKKLHDEIINPMMQSNIKNKQIIEQLTTQQQNQDQEIQNLKQEINEKQIEYDKIMKDFHLQSKNNVKNYNEKIEEKQKELQEIQLQLVQKNNKNMYLESELKLQNNDIEEFQQLLENMKEQQQTLEEQLNIIINEKEQLKLDLDNMKNVNKEQKDFILELKDNEQRLIEQQLQNNQDTLKKMEESRIEHREQEIHGFEIFSESNKDNLFYIEKINELSEEYKENENQIVEFIQNLIGGIDDEEIQEQLQSLIDLELDQEEFKEQFLQIIKKYLEKDSSSSNDGSVDKKDDNDNDSDHDDDDPDGDIKGKDKNHNPFDQIKDIKDLDTKEVLIDLEKNNDYDNNESIDFDISSSNDISKVQFEKSIFIDPQQVQNDDEFFTNLLNNVEDENKKTLGQQIYEVACQYQQLDLHEKKNTEMASVLNKIFNVKKSQQQQYAFSKLQNMKPKSNPQDFKLSNEYLRQELQNIHSENILSRMNDMKKLDYNQFFDKMLSIQDENSALNNENNKLNNEVNYYNNKYIDMINKYNMQTYLMNNDILNKNNELDLQKFNEHLLKIKIDELFTANNKKDKLISEQFNQNYSNLGIINEQQQKIDQLQNQIKQLTKNKNKMNESIKSGELQNITDQLVKQVSEQYNEQKQQIYDRFNNIEIIPSVNNNDDNKIALNDSISSNESPIRKINRRNIDKKKKQIIEVNPQKIKQQRMKKKIFDDNIPDAIKNQQKMYNNYFDVILSSNNNNYY